MPTLPSEVSRSIVSCRLLSKKHIPFIIWLGVKEKPHAAFMLYFRVKSIKSNI